jgi:hypothetical protein
MKTGYKQEFLNGIRSEINRSVQAQNFFKKMLKTQHSVTNRNKMQQIYPLQAAGIIFTISKCPIKSNKDAPLFATKTNRPIDYLCPPAREPKNTLRLFTYDLRLKTCALYHSDRL